MITTIHEAKQSVLWGCRTMRSRGYVLGTAGNISAKVAESDVFVITPTSLPYAKLTEDDLALVDMNGAVVAGRHAPSIEFGMHRAIYANRPDVRCTVHTHSKFATAASSLAGIDCVPIIDIETAFYIGGPIPIAHFAPPGSEELAQNAAAFLGDVAGLLLEGHGAVGVGQTMEEAMTACDNVERTCEMFLCLRACGEIKPLPENFVREYCDQSRKARGVKS